MDSPLIVPGSSGLSPIPRIQGVTAQTAPELETEIRRLITTAAAEDPLIQIVSFQVGQSGERMFWALLGFINAEEYSESSQAGQFGWEEFDTPAAPQTVAIAVADTPVLIPGPTLVTGSPGFAQTAPGDGIIIYGGEFALGGAFEIEYMASVRSATANPTIARLSLLHGGTQVASTLRSITAIQTDFHVVSGTAFRSLAALDTLSLALENATNTDDYEVASASLFAKSVTPTFFPGLENSVPITVANIAVVEVGTVNGMGLIPPNVLINRITALAPTTNNFVQKLCPIGQGSGGPAFLVAALCASYPVAPVI
jgi:hypothetical protein